MASQAFSVAMPYLHEMHRRRSRKRERARGLKEDLGRTSHHNNMGLEPSAGVPITWNATASTREPSRPLTTHRSVLREAAEGDALATLSDAVSLTCTAEMGTPKHLAATWHTLVCRPWPISVPPWLTSTVPSVCTCTREPP